MNFEKPTQHDENKNQVLRFIVLSFIIHGFLFTGLYFSPAPEKNNTLEKETILVEFTPETSKSIKTNNQIVETDLIKQTKDAVENAYLSEKNQIVEKEIKAKTVGSHRAGTTGATANKKDENNKTNTDKNVSLGALGVNVNYKPMGNINPGSQAQNNDYLDNVREGAQTLLNTKEFTFFSFYQRVRRQLEQFWEPGLRSRLDRMIQRGREIASDKEHATKLMVVMNKDGTITRILVENTSGLLDLDQAAIEAFNKAGPFPNPPKEMVEKDGTVKVEWEFVLRT